MAFLDEAGLTRVWAKIKAAFVAKETGKGLSDNNYTTAEKNKLAGIAAGANAYTHPTYTARTGKPTANEAPGFGGTVTISQITSDTTGHVTGANDRTLTIPDDLATDESDGLMSAEDKTKLDGIPSIVGVFARNIGDIEGELATAREEHAAIRQALDAADIRILNTPNLLKKQPKGVSVQVPNGTVITKTVTIPAEDATAAAEALTYTVTDEAITASMVLHGKKSSDGYVYVNWQTITGTAAAGSMTVTIGARKDAHTGSITVTLYICNVTSATLPYGESARWHAYGEAYITSIDNPAYTDEAGDEIKERIVTLTGDNIITDEDDAVYNQAVAFTVSEVPTSGMNNADMLSFYYGNGRYDTDHGYSASLMGDIEEMEVGKTYTLSCFARITSGTKAKLLMVAGSTTYSVTANYGQKNFVEISNTEWKRIWWSFVFSPTGPQYYSYTSDGKTYMSAYWQKKVGIGVCRAYAGTVQLAGFRLTKGGLYGNNTIDTLSAEVEAARDESAAAAAAAQAATTAANKVMTGATASAAGAAGNVPAPAAGDQLKYLRGDGTWDDIRADILNAYPIKAVPVNGMGMLDPQASLSVSDAASGVPPYWIRLVITASSASTATITFTPMLYGTAATFTVDLTALNGGSALTQNTVVDIYDGVRMTISGGATVYLSEVIKTTEQYYTLSCDVANVGTYYRRNVTSVLDALERRIAALENA